MSQFYINGLNIDGTRSRTRCYRCKKMVICYYDVKRENICPSCREKDLQKEIARFNAIVEVLYPKVKITEEDKNRIYAISQSDIKDLDGGEKDDNI